MPSQIKIKRLPSSQWELCRDLRLMALKEEPLAFGSAYEEESDLSEAEWRVRIQNALFAVDQDLPVGMVVLIGQSQRKSRHIGHIFGMYVKPSHCGQGIGQQLMKSAIQSFKDWGHIRKIKLSVNVEQKTAHALYQKLGFREVSLLKDELYHNGSYYDEYMMELRL